MSLPGIARRLLHLKRPIEVGGVQFAMGDQDFAALLDGAFGRVLNDVFDGVEQNDAFDY